MKLSKTLDGIEYGDGEQGEQGPGGHISSQKSLQGAGEHGVMRFLEGGHGVMGPLEDGQGVIGVGTRGREANTVSEAGAQAEADLTTFSSK